MERSRYDIKVNWFLVLATLTFFIFAPKIEWIDDRTAKPIIYGFLRIVIIICDVVWAIGLTDKLQDIISLKYKIIEKNDKLEIKYLTSMFLFIPYWKSYYSTYYTGSVAYNEKIKEHKAKLKKARLEYFNKPTEKRKKVTYV